MKSKIFLFTAFFLLGAAALSYALPMETPASHAILMDAGTGTILLNKKADERMPTSSMSKALTLYVVFEALKAGQVSLTDEFTVSEKAWKMEGSRMFIKVGTKVKVEDLIRGVAIQSGNDATVALAEGIAGSEADFVARMNARAKELGMNNSHFMNASGWPDPEHYSTPRDLATLAHRIISDFPEYYHYFGEKEFTYNKIRQHNRDPLLGKVPGADGIKTGHTEIAGYGLIGSAKRDNRRLIMVINGLPDEKARASEGGRIIEWGFRNFESRTLFKKGEQIEAAEVWLGREERVPLVAEKDLVVVLPLDRKNELKMNAQYTAPLKAPVAQGMPAGKLVINIPDQEPREIPLVTGKSVERTGLFGRVSARVRYLLGAG